MLKRLIYLLLMSTIFYPTFSVSMTKTVTELDEPMILTDLVTDSPLIYNGIRAESSEFPEVGWIEFCTATLVSPDVILTAGHCVATGELIKFLHRESGLVFDATCTQHPDYNEYTTWNDYAFCRLSSPVPEGSHLASLEVQAKPQLDDPVLMLGYGKPNLVNLFYAYAAIAEINDQDIITCVDANLGNGDSGGALFTATDIRDDTAVRSIIGVNSRASTLCSYFNRTTDPYFKRFAEQFERDNDTAICGLSLDCHKLKFCQAVYEELAYCLSEKSPKCESAYKQFAQCL